MNNKTDYVKRLDYNGKKLELPTLNDILKRIEKASKQKLKVSGNNQNNENKE